MIAIDVLVLIDQQEAQPGEDPVTLHRWADFVTLLRLEQPFGGGLDYGIELDGFTALGGNRVTRPGQPHRQTMQGLHDHTAGIRTD